MLCPAEWKILFAFLNLTQNASFIAEDTDSFIAGLLDLNIRVIVIYPYFPYDLKGFFPGKFLIQFLANKMQNFRNFILHNCTVIFDAELVYLSYQLL